jgi:hypothetical protein
MLLYFLDVTEENHKHVSGSRPPTRKSNTGPQEYEVGISIAAFGNRTRRKVDISFCGETSYVGAVFICRAPRFSNSSYDTVRSFSMLHCPRGGLAVVSQLWKLVSIIAWTPFFYKLRTILAEAAPSSIHHLSSPIQQTDRPEVYEVASY